MSFDEFSSRDVSVGYVGIRLSTYGMSRTRPIRRKMEGWTRVKVLIDIEKKAIKFVRSKKEGYSVTWNAPVRARLHKAGMKLGRYILSDENADELTFTFKG